MERVISKNATVDVAQQSNVNYGKVLKMVYGMENGSKLTHELKNPKTGLTRTAVENVMGDAITKQAIVVAGGFYAATIDDAYIVETTRIELS